jgi:hypothetical protein|tara:strand:+ start:1191 stop:1367 length:177 start_codon:yes stop_codon:yes gene_type:complete
MEVIEKGNAGVNIELSNGVITVRHSECNSILKQWTARKGDWNLLFGLLEEMEKQTDLK